MGRLYHTCIAYMTLRLSRVREIGPMRSPSHRGVTLLEMIMVITIILILMGAAVPVVKMSVRRQRETEFRQDLLEMRPAVDRYKDASHRNMFQIKLDSQGHPPDLGTLVKRVATTRHKQNPLFPPY